MKSYELLIFDWDGTLIDSTDKIITCMQSAFVSSGLTPPPYADVKNIIGLGLPEAICKLLPGIGNELALAVRESYSAHFSEADKTPCNFYTGVTEGLNALKNQGYTLAIATGKSRKGLDRVLSALGLDNFFHLTRCADETESKPSPLMLNEIISEARTTPANALMVGDTEYDLEMARHARVDSVAVSYGAHHIERLLKHHPKKSIDQFSQLIDFLQDNHTE